MKIGEIGWTIKVRVGRLLLLTIAMAMAWGLGTFLIHKAIIFWIVASSPQVIRGVPL